jgi:hypothetical protein
MSTDSRRNFVKASAASFMIVAPHTVRGSQANSAMTLGLIGCGNRGMYVSGLFAKNEYARVAAFTDIYEDKFAAAAAKYSAEYSFIKIKCLLCVARKIEVSAYS